MPELSRFYGLVITMYIDDHIPAHIHIDYDGEEIKFDIVEGVFIKGHLPPRETRLLLAWYEIHREELLNNWENLTNGKERIKIQPLN